ncbi:prepilin-type N-terminal cleavage/methylation domain-containing protein [Pseudoduganella buxea]|uniref:Prepilin-type N-terminal cleavage/methylation domain-containing protein n=1 Tax=Pseudoduganella buxea TaxID=1949069 RepID=A0A6I3SYQ2_9BURK|nr:prepilin-type N-terminal cleavage/methylation domain-containing protein [Pseudoduganella buxea]MTV54390.1 prepilin-type N-terminal cleavage/methylation domain-containing protein [Pseudoduganella buxea]GGC11010.1 hypothetical protein GCM10011572_35420 [Pseudoduganella buxea]
MGRPDGAATDRHVTCANAQVTPARLSGSKTGQSGFTLVELVIVLVVVGILAAFASQRFFNRSTYDAAGYSNQVGSLIRYGQKLAIAQNRSVFVRLNGSSVALCYDAACTAANLVQSPGGNSSDSAATRLHCNNARWACEGVPAGLAVTAHPTFYFDPAGTPFALADVQPTLVSTFATLVVQVSGNGIVLATRIEAATGYVH